MLKRFLPVLCVLVLCLSSTVPTAFAAVSLVPDKTISFQTNGSTSYEEIYFQGRPLTLQFLKDNPAFSFSVSCGRNFAKIYVDGVYVGELSCSNYTTFNAAVLESCCDLSSCNSYGVIGLGGPYSQINGLAINNLNVPDSITYSYPAPPSGVSGTDYALYYSGGYYYCLYDLKPLESSVSYSGAEYIINYTVEEPVSLYSYTTSGWSLVSQNLTGSHSFRVSSNADIIHYPEVLKYDGADFFSPPLTLEQATETGLENLLETTGAAVLILVSLGVCLMALWIGLSLLSRVLYRYLG